MTTRSNANDRPGLRARKMARTREQILDAALLAFTRDGYQNTTLEQVADAADVHKRTLLRYFPSKAHLVLDRQYNALKAFQQALEKRDGASAIDVWTDHVLNYSRKISERGTAGDFHRIAMSEPALRQAYSDVQESYQSLIASVLEQEMGDDFAARIKARVVAGALVAGNYAVGGMIMRDGAHDRLEEAEREVLRLIADGIAKV